MWHEFTVIQVSWLDKQIDPHETLLLTFSLLARELLVLCGFIIILLTVNILVNLEVY